MTKITFIGAGSLGFTSELVRGVLTFPLLEDAHISLMDIDEERLDFANESVKKLIAAGNRHASLTALLTQLSSGIEEMAIQASLTGDPTMIYRAICHDPLTASVLSLAEIKEMTNELFAHHKDYPPQFKHHVV